MEARKRDRKKEHMMSKRGHPKDDPMRNILIYCDRKHKGMTYPDLAKKYNLSLARPYQICHKVKRQLDYWYNAYPDMYIFRINEEIRKDALRYIEHGRHWRSGTI